MVDPTNVRWVAWTIWLQGKSSWQSNSDFYIRLMRLFLQMLSFFVFPSLFIAGCNRYKTQQEFDFTRLIGRWSCVNADASQMEEWEQLSDSAFAGLGYVLEGGDTTFFETLEIRKEGGVWTYYAKVNQMNGSEIVPFRLTRQNWEKVEFSNPSHDFPKKIGYELISNDALQAYIEGPRDGQVVRILFDFKRKF